MNLDNFNDRLAIVSDLIGYSMSILDSLDLDFGDELKLHIFMERLFAFQNLMIVENNLTYALHEIDDMKQSDEDSKWTFPLEKQLNSFFKEIFLPPIDSFINFSGSWSFNDYQARKFQKDLCQKMEMLRDWYKNEYGFKELDCDK